MADGEWGRVALVSARAFGGVAPVEDQGSAVVFEGEFGAERVVADQGGQGAFEAGV